MMIDDNFLIFKDVINFSPVHAHLCTSGQPTFEQLIQIKEQGFGTVINLALSNASNHLLHEDRICLELGLDYIQVPLLWDCPSSSASLFVLDLIDHLVQEQKVWVHCSKNFRVSALMYLYRQYFMGMDIVQADEYLSGIWQLNQTWTGLVHAIQLQLQARQATKEIQHMC